jgi:tyrosine-protein phosphatase SIW14
MTRCVVCGRRRSWVVAGLLVIASAGASVASGSEGEASAGASQYRFAERIERLKGVDNVGRVAPGFYRGSAPSPEGLDSLKALGVRTVVNLRHYHGTREEEWCRERGLRYEPIATASSNPPADEDVRRFLQVVTDPSRQPVYVHCWRGKDRTGAMCAIYRMAIEGWPLEAARAEMEAFGFYAGWRDLLDYVEAFPVRRDAVWPVSP